MVDFLKIVGQCAILYTLLLYTLYRSSLNTGHDTINIKILHTSYMYSNLKQDLVEYTQSYMYHISVLYIHATLLHINLKLDIKVVLKSFMVILRLTSVEFRRSNLIIFKFYFKENLFNKKSILKIVN